MLLLTLADLVPRTQSVMAIRYHLLLRHSRLCGAFSQQVLSVLTVSAMALLHCQGLQNQYQQKLLTYKFCPFNKILYDLHVYG